ncbi:MAG: hypothetical protein QXH71_01065 [Candidatus Anstonellaceae archaeon]
MDVLSLIGKVKLSLISKDLCPSCKKNGRVHCPHKQLLKIKNSPLFNKDYFFGPTPPNIFVPYFNYPKVFPQQIFLLDDTVVANPKYWYGSDFKKIIYYSSMQVRADLADKSQNSLSNLTDSVLSIKKVDVEANYLKKPQLLINFDQVNYPLGPLAVVDKVVLASNPKIPKRVDSLINDDILASEAIKKLSLAGFDEFYILRIFSLGLLGKKRNKKFVPTRWSITAIDSTLAKINIEQLKKFSLVDKILVFENFYLANKFTIILFPSNWEFENIEVWCGSKTNFAISVEKEGFFGRTNFASKQGGGYYASLFAVSEALAKKLQKQAGVLVIREIMPEYDLPVGVWEIRENIRHAFEKNPKIFESKKELFEYLKKTLFLDLLIYLKNSSLLSQRLLQDF